MRNVNGGGGRVVREAITSPGEVNTLIYIVPPPGKSKVYTTDAPDDNRLHKALFFAQYRINDHTYQDKISDDPSGITRN